MLEDLTRRALTEDTVANATEVQSPPIRTHRAGFRNRLLIIQPTYRVSPDGPLYKTKRRSLVGLTLPYLAALTPADWDVTLLDEQVQDIDFDAAVDLVAISTWTINSLRAYEISARFRDRGVPVLMGGPHTYFHSDEASAHCDAVERAEAVDCYIQRRGGMALLLPLMLAGYAG